MTIHHQGDGALASCVTTKICPKCSDIFIVRRRDAQFCSRKCQRNSSRGPRTIQHSPTERRRNQDHYCRALQLAADLYSTPPNQRLGFIKDLIDAARSNDSQLRSIFTDPKLLFPNRNEPWWFYRRCPSSYCTISQAADRYCRKYMGSGVREVVSPNYSEPETGEVL
jgi:hypothetical protein